MLAVSMAGDDDKFNPVAARARKGGEATIGVPAVADTPRGGRQDTGAVAGAEPKPRWHRLSQRGKTSSTRAGAAGGGEGTASGAVPMNRAAAPAGAGAASPRPNLTVYAIKPGDEAEGSSTRQLAVLVELSTCYVWTYPVAGVTPTRRSAQ